jgi:putative phosphoesterase
MEKGRTPEGPFLSSGHGSESQRMVKQMKIGVVSDTHLREPDAEFRRAIQFHFSDVEKILHAGDFVAWAVAEYLSGVQELVAVCGNMDSMEIERAFQEKGSFIWTGLRWASFTEEARHLASSRG